MPIVIESLGVAYFPVPKAACTSVKLALYELEHGRPYDRAAYGGAHIHRYYRKRRGFDTMAEVTSSDYTDCRGYWTFAVIRDPIRRILSTYTNRILHHDDLTTERRHGVGSDGEACDLPARPDLDFFVANLELYRQASESIDHHTKPQWFYLGPDWRQLDRIYKVEDIDDLEQELAERAGRGIRIRRANAKGPKLSFAELSAATQERLRELTRAEYAWLRPLCDPP